MEWSCYDRKFVSYFFDLSEEFNVFWNNLEFKCHHHSQLWQFVWFKNNPWRIFNKQPDLRQYFLFSFNFQVGKRLNQVSVHIMQKIFYPFCRWICLYSFTRPIGVIDHSFMKTILSKYVCFIFLFRCLILQKYSIFNIHRIMCQLFLISATSHIPKEKKWVFWGHL